MNHEAKTNDIIRITYNLPIESTPPGETRTICNCMKDGMFIAEEDGMVKILKGLFVVGIPLEWIINIVVVQPAVSNLQCLPDHVRHSNPVTPGFALTFEKTGGVK